MTRASSRSADQLGVDQGGDRPHRREALGEIAIVDADPESPLELVDELDAHVITQTDGDDHERRTCSMG